MKRNSKCLAYYRREIRDPYDDRYWTAITCSILEPTAEWPVPSVHISVANARGKVLFRVHDVDEATRIVRLPTKAKARLQTAFRNASVMADRIEADMKLMFARRQLAPGSHIVRTDTGEIVAEAERILKET